MDDIKKQALEHVFDSAYLAGLPCTSEGSLGFEVKRVSKSVMNILERCILKDFAYRRLCSPEVQMWFVPLRFR